MNSHIQQILNDLYAIDPTFRKHETKLVSILSELVVLKPNITIDQNFANKLRGQLQVKAAHMEEAQNNSYTTKTVRKLSWLTYAFATFGLVALATSSFVYYRAQQPAIKNAQEIVSLFSKDTQVKSVEPHSFGSLATVSLTNAAGKGGGNNITQTDSSVPAGETTTMPADPKMVPSDYTPINYKFVYKGGVFQVPAKQMDVLQRNKNLSSSGTNNILDKISFGLFDINKFTNRQLDNISISEDRDNGYAINANFREGTASINANWQRWSVLNQINLCRDQACYEKLQLKASDVPEDSALIAIASDFLDSYGINRSTYGDPIVQDLWRQDLIRSQSYGGQTYVPDVITIIYPVKIQGQTVYDEGGYPTGLMVSVNIRANAVTDVMDISTQSYRASAYDTETDTSRLIQLAETGSFHNYPIYQDPAATTQTIELGTPTISYARVWKYDAMNSQELFVPALIFPITKNYDKQPFYQKNIVIPLVKDILDSAQFPPIGIMSSGAGSLPQATEPAKPVEVK